MVGFGELLLRLSTVDSSLLLQESTLKPTFCGAEANVLAALAGFGHRARFVSSLPDNVLGHAGRAQLAALSVETLAQMPPQARMGLFFLEPGAMMRPSRITYDRAASAFARSGAQDYDWGTLLDGADWLFVSGITAALGEGPLAALHAVFDAAEAQGVRIAFYTNLRPSLWQEREEEAARILRAFSCRSHLLFAGRRATAMMVGGGYDQTDPGEGFNAAAQAMFAQSDSLTHMAATRREITSSDEQNLTALLADRDGYSSSDTVALDHIVDQVGTGDAFAAGIVHGLANSKTRQDSVDFAAACAAWAHSVPGDFLRASTADIESLNTGGKDVRR